MILWRGKMTGAAANLKKERERSLSSDRPRSPDMKTNF